MMRSDKVRFGFYKEVKEVEAKNHGEKNMDLDVTME